MSALPSRQAERRVRKRAANRAAILDAARALAERDGSGELSLRAVAAEAGYAPATVYEYFRNRADLVLTLAADDLGRIARSVKTAGGSGRLAPAARTALEALRHNMPLAAAAVALEEGDAPLETERHFNGKLIGALIAFAEATGRAPAVSRDAQVDIMLSVATLVGLAVFSRAGRLQALGLYEEELLARLERRFAKGLSA